MLPCRTFQGRSQFLNGGSFPTTKWKSTGVEWKPMGMGLCKSFSTEDNLQWPIPPLQKTPKIPRKWRKRQKMLNWCLTNVKIGDHMQAIGNKWKDENGENISQFRVGGLRNVMIQIGYGIQDHLVISEPTTKIIPEIANSSIDFRQNTNKEENRTSLMNMWLTKAIVGDFASKS